MPNLSQLAFDGAPDRGRAPAYVRDGVSAAVRAGAGDLRADTPVRLAARPARGARSRSGRTPPADRRGLWRRPPGGARARAALARTEHRYRAPGMRRGRSGRRDARDPGRRRPPAVPRRDGRYGDPGQRRRPGARAAHDPTRGAPCAGRRRAARAPRSERSLPPSVGAPSDRARPARQISRMGHLSGGPPLRVHALGSPPSRRARGFPGARALELGPGLAGAGGEARGGRHAPAMGTRDDRRRRGDAGRALARSLARRAVARALRAQGAAMSVRVLHAITRLTLGGSSENTIASCAALARAGYECSLTASFRESDASSLADARRRGCRLVDIPALGREVAPLADLIALAQLIHLIRRERPSIVHTHTSKAGFIGRLAAVIARVPAVIHQPHGHIFYGYYSPRRTAVFTALERRAAHWTDRIITLTDRGSVEHLARGIRPAAP